jgi:polysaccharide deacetylase family protein (PEP-CTERM system associated)
MTGLLQFRKPERAASAEDSVTHCFTVDVEEYFHVSALEPYVRRRDWDRLESRVAVGVDRLLSLLDQVGARATFFVLGWIAGRHRELVRSIADAGHEVASHGWDHRRIIHETPDQFRHSVRRTKATLEDITGCSVLGFRAPSFSIVPGLEWAIEVLVEEGYRYDSSLFPVLRRGYGYPGGGRDPHWLETRAGAILEVPPATLRVFGRNIPAAGGAYFRLFPYKLVRTALRDATRRNVSATFYIHPWELDPNQPRLSKVPWLTRVRHYGGLARTVPRVKRLLAEFRFSAIADQFTDENGVDS